MDLALSFTRLLRHPTGHGLLWRKSSSQELQGKVTQRIQRKPNRYYIYFILFQCQRRGLRNLFEFFLMLRAVSCTTPCTWGSWMPASSVGGLKNRVELLRWAASSWTPRNPGKRAAWEPLPRARTSRNAARKLRTCGKMVAAVAAQMRKRREKISSLDLMQNECKIT